MLVSGSRDDGCAVDVGEVGMAIGAASLRVLTEPIVARKAALTRELVASIFATERARWVLPTSVSTRVVCLVGTTVTVARTRDVQQLWCGRGHGHAQTWFRMSFDIRRP
jgi:hypothetical protein